MLDRKFNQPLFNFVSDEERELMQLNEFTKIPAAGRLEISVSVKLSTDSFVGKICTIESVRQRYAELKQAQLDGRIVRSK